MLPGPCALLPALHRLLRRHSPKVEVSVYDMDALSRDLVGQFFIDALTVYYSPKHELHNVWVALSAPQSARKSLLGKDADGGIQGYLKLCLVLLGPNDKAEAHDDDDEEEEGGIMMPPSMKKELVFLRIGVLRAEKLPSMDSAGKGI